jgi:hypothetical protein
MCLTRVCTTLKSCQLVWMQNSVWGSPLPIDKSSLKTYVLVLRVSSCEYIDKLSFVLSNSPVHCLSAFFNENDNLSSITIY